MNRQAQTQASEPLAAYLRLVEPDSRRAINAWLGAHGTKRLRLFGRDLELRWSDPMFLHMQFGVELTFGARRALVALDSFAAVDPLLVGRPFAGMPEPQRNLVVQQRVARVLETLPPALSEAADVHAVHWSMEAFPRWDCALGFALTRLPEGVESQGVLATESAVTLDWLRERLPSAVPPATDRGDLPLSLALWLGVTRLRPADLRGLASGDVVLIESGGHTHDGIAVSLVTPDGRRVWNCRLRRNHLRVNGARGDALPTAKWDAAGSHVGVLADDLSGADTMNDESPALEIPVTFDLGKLSVALRDLEQLQPGYLFELPQDASEAIVKLRVSGTTVAEGRLVAVGKRLGVRIVQMRARLDPGI